MRTQPRHIRIRPSRQNNIADKLLAPRAIRPRNNRSLRHARMPHQRRLDLPRLNAEAANLNLMVRAPHKLQNPIPAPARQVPAAVHPPPRSTKPIRNKALTRQSAATNIPPPNPSTRNVKLPNNTNRHRLQTTVQYINPRVPDRTTKRHTRWKAVHLTTAICGRPNTTLSWAIFIYQWNSGEELIVLDRQVRWTCLTRDNNRLQSLSR